MAALVVVLLQERAVSAIQLPETEDSLKPAAISFAVRLKKAAICPYALQEDHDQIFGARSRNVGPE